MTGLADRRRCFFSRYRLKAANRRSREQPVVLLFIMTELLVSSISHTPFVKVEDNEREDGEGEEENEDDDEDNSLGHG